MKLLLTTCILAAVAVGAIVGARPAIALPSWPEPDFGALCRSADIVAMVTVDAHLGVATASTGEQVDSGKAGVRAVDPGEILRGFGVTVHRYTIDRTGKFLGKFVIWQATGQEATQWPDAGWRVGLPPNLAPPALLPYLLVPGDAYVVFARLADLSSADLRAADPAPVHEEASQSGSPGPVLLVDRPEAVTPTFYSWGGSGEETVIQELRSAEVEPGNYAACQIDWAYHTLESYCRGAAPWGDEPMVEAAVRAMVTEMLGAAEPCMWTLYRAVVEENLAPVGVEPGRGLVPGTVFEFAIANRTPACPANLLPELDPGRRCVLLLTETQYGGRQGWWVFSPVAVSPVLEPDRVELRWDSFGMAEQGKNGPASVPLEYLEAEIRRILGGK